MVGEMTGADVLADAFERIPQQVYGVLDGLTPDQLTFRVDGEANTIAWLVWHLSRIEDDHVADVAGRPQVWTSDGWARRWRLPFEDSDTGYGHTSEQVASVTGDAELLRGYFDAVHEMTVRYVRSLSAGDLDRVVDKEWDPPVTLGVRLVSVAGHNFEQLAQADFVRGVLDRTKPRSTKRR